jgi:hypothetical protein
VDDKGGDNVIDLKRSKLSIREMLASPAPPRERPADTSGPRPGQPPVPAEVPPAAWRGEDAGTPPEARARHREQGELDLALPDVLDPLPKAGDPYRAHSRAGNKPLLTVSFLLRDATSSRGFSYATFDSIDLLPSPTPSGGPVIVIRFAGLAPTEIRIEGRNLSTLHAYLGEHRVAWVRERGGRDFLEESAAVVSGITMTALS